MCMIKSLFWFVPILLLLMLLCSRTRGQEIEKDCNIDNETKKLTCNMYSDNEIFRFYNSQHNNYFVEKQNAEIDWYLHFTQELRRKGKIFQRSLKQNIRDDKVGLFEKSVSYVKNIALALGDPSRRPEEMQAISYFSQQKKDYDFRRYPQGKTFPTLGDERWTLPKYKRSAFKPSGDDYCSNADQYTPSQSAFGRVIFRCTQSKAFLPSSLSASVSLVFYGRAEPHYTPYFRNWFISFPASETKEYFFPTNPSLRFAELFSPLQHDHLMYVHIPVAFKVVAKGNGVTRSQILSKSQTDMYVKVAKRIIQKEIRLCPTQDKQAENLVKNQADHEDDRKYSEYSDSENEANGEYDDNVTPRVMREHCADAFKVEIEPRWLLTPTERFKESDDGELFVLAYAVFETNPIYGLYDVVQGWKRMVEEKHVHPYLVVLETFFSPYMDEVGFHLTGDSIDFLMHYFADVSKDRNVFTAKKGFVLRHSKGKNGWKHVLEVVEGNMEKNLKELLHVSKEVFETPEDQRELKYGQLVLDSLKSIPPLNQFIKHINYLQEKSEADLNTMYVNEFVSERKRMMKRKIKTADLGKLLDRRVQYRFLLWPGKARNKNLLKGYDSKSFLGAANFPTKRLTHGNEIKVAVRKEFSLDKDRRSVKNWWGKSWIGTLGSYDDKVYENDIILVNGVNFGQKPYMVPNRYALPTFTEILGQGGGGRVVIETNSLDEGFMNTRISSYLYAFASYFHISKGAQLSAHSNGNLQLAFALFCYAHEYVEFDFSLLKTTAHDIHGDPLNGYPINGDTEKAFREFMCFDLDLYNQVNAAIYDEEYWNMFTLPSIKYPFHEQLGIISIEKQKQMSLYSWVANKPPWLGANFASLAIEHLCRGDRGITTKGSVARNGISKSGFLVPITCVMSYFQLGEHSVGIHIAAKYATSRFTGFTEDIRGNGHEYLKKKGLQINIDHHINLEHGNQDDESKPPAVRQLICGQGVYQSATSRTAKSFAKATPPLKMLWAGAHPKQTAVSAVNELMMAFVGHPSQDIHSDGFVTQTQCVGFFYYNICYGVTNLLNLYGVNVGFHDFWYADNEEPDQTNVPKMVLYTFVNENLEYNSDVTRCRSIKRPLFQSSKCTTAFGKNLHTSSGSTLSSMFTKVKKVNHNIWKANSDDIRNLKNYKAQCPYQNEQSAVYLYEH